mgnify:CR=1 FL=1
MPQKYSVLVVGMGKRGKHHATAFNANENFKVIGICDIDEAKLKIAATELGNPQTGSDASKMAKELNPDVFCFCTMPHIRLDMIKIAVQNNAKLVAFEKPLSLSMREANQIKKMLESSSIKAVVSHQHKYGVHYKKIKEIVETGKLGRIQTIYASALGWMTHMMSHLIDYMLWYNSYTPAEWVMAQSSGKNKFSDNHPSPDYIGGFIHFKNGVHGIIECGAGAPDQPDVEKWWGKNRICVQGTQGFAEVLTNGGWRAVTSDGVLTGSGAMNYDFDMPPYIQEMADWLNEGKVHSCSLDKAFIGCEIFMAMCRSAAVGGQITLPLDDGIPEMELLKQKMTNKKAIPSTPATAKEYQL